MTKDDALVSEDLAELIASRAVAASENGGSDLDIVAQVIGRTIERGLTPSMANIERVVAAFVRLPEPPDQSTPDATTKRINSTLRARQALQVHAETMKS